MPKKDPNKPKGKMSAYAAFVQTCRDEHRKKNPNESIVLAEFAKKCGEKWKAMNAKEKKRFEDMAEKDKVRFDKEMASYIPQSGDGKRKTKKKKDPNAPKRAMSGFFWFSNEERAKVRAKYPDYKVSDVAKELGKRWEVCTNRAKYEALAQKDKERYAKEIAAYKKGGGGKSPPAKKAKQSAAAAVDDDDDEEEEDESEEESD